MRVDRVSVKPAIRTRVQIASGLVSTMNGLVGRLDCHVSLGCPSTGGLAAQVDVSLGCPSTGGLAAQVDVALGPAGHTTPKSEKSDHILVRRHQLVATLTGTKRYQFGTMVHVYTRVHVYHWYHGVSHTMVLEYQLPLVRPLASVPVAPECLYFKLFLRYR
jgi:hypothetical protein